MNRWEFVRIVALGDIGGSLKRGRAAASTLRQGAQFTE